MKSRMNGYVAVGLTIGVLAGIWTWASAALGLITWVGFVSWALFFAAGGGRAGVLKVVPAALTGVAYGALLLAAVSVLPVSPVTLPIGITVIAFLMCVQANWKPLAFIPGAFAGCAALFGGAGDWLGVGVALVAGALLGWASEVTASAINRPRIPTRPSSEARLQH